MSDYYPDMEAEWLDDMLIEYERIEFRKEWFAYSEDRGFVYW